MQATETTTFFHEDGAVLEVIPEDIPAELKSFGHWVVWRLEERDRELTKVPYNAKTGRYASTADSRTWSTFPKALQAFQSGRWDGVGFVFSSGDPFFGIDLDDCRDPESGELEEWAQAILSAFPNAYREVSPSARGIHIIARGGKAPNGKRGRLEAYSERRFFTISGRVI